MFFPRYYFIVIYDMDLYIFIADLYFIDKKIFSVKISSSEKSTIEFQ